MLEQPRISIRLRVHGSEATSVHDEEAFINLSEPLLFVILLLARGYLTGHVTHMVEVGHDVTVLSDGQLCSKEEGCIIKRFHSRSCSPACKNKGCNENVASAAKTHAV